MLNVVYPDQVLTKYNNPDAFLAFSRKIVKSLEKCLERPELASVKEDLSCTDCFANLKSRVS